MTAICTYPQHSQSFSYSCNETRVRVAQQCGDISEVRRRRLKVVRKVWGVIVREAKVLHGHTGGQKDEAEGYEEEAGCNGHRG
jgi:hypothetical protein